jgi:hypothetical protein
MENRNWSKKYEETVSAGKTAGTVNWGALEFMIVDGFRALLSNQPEKLKMYEKHLESVQGLASNLARVSQTGFVSVLDGLEQIHADNLRIIKLLEESQKKNEK